MYFDTLTTLKSFVQQLNGVSTPITDASGDTCRVHWQQTDPRATLPESVDMETTSIGFALTADLPNPQLIRFPTKIQSPLISNGRRIVRESPHPEPRLLQVMCHIRSEGRLAEADVTKVSLEVRKRLKHRRHLSVPVDLYRDGRIFNIPSLLLVTTTSLNRPDGVVRKVFSYDLVYTLESWILFQDQRTDLRAMETLNMELRRGTTESDSTLVQTLTVQSS